MKKYCIKIYILYLFLKWKSCTVCAGMCKILTWEYRENVQRKEMIIEKMCINIMQRVRCGGFTLNIH